MPHPPHSFTVTCFTFGTFVCGEKLQRTNESTKKKIPDKTRTFSIAQHLFHVGVLVPKFVDARQQRDCTVPDVAGVIHKLVFHLHVGVTDKDARVVCVDIQGSLEHRAGSVEVMVRRFPLGILQ